MREYILYKVHNDDELFIDLGTSKELSKLLGISMLQFHQLVKDSKRKRSKRPQEGKYKVYKLEEE